MLGVADECVAPGFDYAGTGFLKQNRFWGPADLIICIAGTKLEIRPGRLDILGSSSNGPKTSCPGFRASLPGAAAVSRAVLWQGGRVSF